MYPVFIGYDTVRRREFDVLWVRFDLGSIACLLGSSKSIETYTDHILVEYGIANDRTDDRRQPNRRRFQMGARGRLTRNLFRCSRCELKTETALGDSESTCTLIVHTMQKQRSPTTLLRSRRRRNETRAFKYNMRCGSKLIKSCSYWMRREPEWQWRSPDRRGALKSTFSTRVPHVISLCRHWRPSTRTHQRVYYIQLRRRVTR